jgi:hypothetical protein
MKANEAAYQFNEFQLKWLEALESGEYEQGKEKLFDGSGYCCLGVGCDVLGIEPHEDDGAYMFDGENVYAPKSLISALRLNSRTGAFRNYNRFDVGAISVPSLTSANDEGATFADIAAFIRANPEKVFQP